MSIPRFAFLLSVLLCLADIAHSQSPFKASIGGTGFNAILESNENSEEERLTGFCAGGLASISKGRFTLAVRYLEGSIDPEGDGTARDLVEGEALLGIRAFPWLGFRFGPHLRSYIQGGVVDRRVMWEGRIRTETQLGIGGLSSYLEFWSVLSGSAREPSSFGSGQGLEGGIRLETSAFPLWLGLGYRLDKSELDSGAREEVLQQLVFAIGFGRGGGI